MLYIFNCSMCEVMFSFLKEQCKYCCDTHRILWKVPNVLSVYSSSKLSLTAGHLLHPSMHLHSVLIDGVTTMQYSCGLPSR